ncbi:hypothetical protein PPL_04768 [Heterostelium album PN500]|uniref:Uncharacterized protein n=1 Tax=Heterostelium pallidum (strain ATCC 26659 / Pp 5 / PN500) TaxID=670386 RepID=D3B8H5_HETP5|nr:hypothetical protein PPL_04768 [Heterostelium album PN500]EFA82343.1 hypothetical protein PPL_04768 [Heterostelium album PN500]|eukprot:XP_020434460.1 hypothetical protein PPL_04768 [Heterostelium album PN500]
MRRATSLSLTFNEKFDDSIIVAINIYMNYTNHPYILIATIVMVFS